MAKPGEGVYGGQEEDEDRCAKQHIKDHIDNDDWGLVIEMAWQFYKRKSGCKCLRLK